MVKLFACLGVYAYLTSNENPNYSRHPIDKEKNGAKKEDRGITILMIVDFRDILRNMFMVYSIVKDNYFVFLSKRYHKTRGNVKGQECFFLLNAAKKKRILTMYIDRLNRRICILTVDKEADVAYLLSAIC